MNANENQMPVYVLQPEISGEIKQATLEELKDWIKDGKLEPHHQVRIKNLSWVVARNVPAFQTLFESKMNDQTDQSNQFYSQPLPDTSASEQIESKIKNSTALSKEKPVSTADTTIKENSKTVEPSEVFKAFEKNALAKSKPSERKTEPARSLLRKPKKSFPFKQAISFAAGCILAFLISFGGSYFWVYQLKTPVEIDEKNLPALAALENKLTSDKLDLRLQEEAKARKLKEVGQQQNPQQSDVSQQILQLEKQSVAQRKTVIENHQNKLKDTDFTTTFSFSLAVLLSLFLVTRILYGKKSQPIKNQYSSRLPAPKTQELSDIPAADIRKIDVENFQNLSESDVTDEKKTAELFPLESADKTEYSGKIIDIAENSEAEDSPKISNCLLHQNKSSKFVCESCGSHFCDQCVKTLDEVENCCPLCKVVCTSLESNINEVTPNSDANNKKKTNLLDLGKDSNFIVYDFPDERTRKLGIIPAFLIALLFSVSISIFWVYKISPYLENRNKEISQNISPDEAKNSEQAANTSLETANAQTNDTGLTAPANEPCIDPETRQPFECDEETRKALYEHTRKVKSVEDAQKAVSEKTSVISGLTSENAKQENAKPNADEATITAVEKQQLIKSFGISFIVIFGLLLLSRLFSKAKNS